MLKRTITAIFIILVSAPACLFSHTVVWPIFVSLLSLFAVYEMLGCVGTRRCAAITIPALAAAAVFPFAVRMSSSVKDTLCLFLIGMIIYLFYLFT